MGSDPTILPAVKAVIADPTPAKLIVAGNVPEIFAALISVNACALRAGKIVGKEASGIIPLIFPAVILVNADPSPGGKPPESSEVLRLVKLLASNAGSLAEPSNWTN